MKPLPGVPILAILGALTLAPIARPAIALAQTAMPPGSTANGTVPTSEGNVWNGLDHQPTPSETAPQGASQRARADHKINRLDKQLLNDPLPKSPAGAPPVTGG